MNADEEIRMLEDHPIDDDHKTDKSDPSARTEGMDLIWMIEDLEAVSVYRNIEPVLGKAVVDPDFRQRLEQDPAAAAVTYDLNRQELDWLRQIDLKLLDQMAEEIRNHFSEPSNPSTQLALSLMLAELIWGTETWDRLSHDDAAS